MKTFIKIVPFSLLATQQKQQGKKKGLTIFSGEKCGILKIRDERECLAYSDDNMSSNSKHW